MRHSANKPNTALCYVRLSVSKDDDPSDSPEVQRANIRAVCEEHGYTPEFYEDVNGHKSGTSTDNRPGWQALERRLGDDDVVALVANDLSRLHRRGWKVGQLLDLLQKHNIALILAAPGRHLDTTTVEGRLFVQFAALFDEWYARDISMRTTAAIAAKKKRHITHARPPFGTIRGDDRYLHPSPDGVWVLPDGAIQIGTADQPPHPDAVWRGYYDAVKRILELYAPGTLGYLALTHRINSEGYFFLTKSGPGRFDLNAIKRIIRAWPEYGGTVMTLTPKKRSATTLAGINIDDYISSERALFDPQLLRAVAQTFLNRRAKNTGTGKKRTAYTYALQGILVCHHCAQRAEQEGNPRLRTTLVSRRRANGVRYYQHKPGAHCGCTRKGIPCAELEQTFSEILKQLTIRADVLEALAHEGAAHASTPVDDADFMAEKTEALALARRKFEASKYLFRQGDITREEYEADKAAYQATVAEWEERSRAVRRIVIPPSQHLAVLHDLHALWQDADTCARYNLARFFDEVVVNLDTGEIVRFKLVEWAERLLFDTPASKEK
ncbi:MAG: hypothetical protein Kow0077_22770 [Anaerolineae bacterium]